MKKIYYLLILVVISFSCSNDEIVSKDNPQQRKPGRVINALDPTKLARVIFYPGTSNERRWFFYPNGLLKKIVDANGTLLQTFVYDTNNNLVQFQLFAANPILSIYTYDGNNRLSNINTNGNNFPFNFNPATNSYFVGASFTMNLNTDNIFGSEWYLDYYDYEDENGNSITVPYNHYGLFCSYNNNNQTASGNNDNPSTYYFQHDNKPNPFKTALLPICKILPLTKTFGIFNYWLNANFNSQNNVTLESDNDDLESAQFEYVYNSNNLPISQTRRRYFSTTLEATTLDILYYYQGDPIP